KYVPASLLDEWSLRDPLLNYENYLLSERIISEVEIEEYKKEFKEEIDHNLELAFAEPTISSSVSEELSDVYKNFEFQEVKGNYISENIRLIDAVSQGLKQSMERHDNLVIMGQDIAEYGGVFKISEGFVEAFGKERVRNTPI